MVVSKSKNFVFIRNIKTGSTSMQKLLEPEIRKIEQSRLAKFARMAIPAVEKKTWLFYDFKHRPHTSAAFAKSMIPLKQWNQMWKFGLVRQPDQWIYSIYRHSKRRSGDYFIGNINIQRIKTFDDFLLAVRDSFLPLQSFQFCDLDGEVLTDSTGSFSEIRKYAQFVSARLGISRSIEHLNKDSQYQRQPISSKSLSLIEELCEIDYLVFNFDNIDATSGEVSLQINGDTRRQLAAAFEGVGGLNYDPWRFSKKK